MALGKAGLGLAAACVTGISTLGAIAAFEKGKNVGRPLVCHSAEALAQAGLDGFETGKTSAEEALASCKRDFETATTAFAKSAETMDRVLVTLGEKVVVSFSNEAVETSTHTEAFGAACDELASAKERLADKEKAASIEAQRQAAKKAGIPFVTLEEGKAAGHLDEDGSPVTGRKYIDGVTEDNYATTTTVTEGQ